MLPKATKCGIPLSVREGMGGPLRPKPTIFANVTAVKGVHIYMASHLS